jgi:hypothetical protein
MAKLNAENAKRLHLEPLEKNNLKKEDEIYCL